MKGDVFEKKVTSRPAEGSIGSALPSSMLSEGTDFEISLCAQIRLQ